MTVAEGVLIMASWRHFAFPVLAALSVLAESSAAEKNGTLTIEQKNGAAASGEARTIKVLQSDSSLYETPQFSFEHPAAIKVEVTSIDDALSQHVSATPNGTVIIVQHHLKVNDEDLEKVRDIFLNNALGGPASKGLKIVRSNISRKLHDGKEIKGIRAMFANGPDEFIMAIYTMRLGEGALMFVTIFNKNTGKDEGIILDQFWETLRVKG
jgi:hypothetical protein